MLQSESGYRGVPPEKKLYSVAISLHEYSEETGQVYPVQMSAFDVSSTAVEKARSANYADDIVADVSPELFCENRGRTSRARLGANARGSSPENLDRASNRLRLQWEEHVCH